MTLARLLCAMMVASLLASCASPPPPPVLRIGLIGVFEGPARNASGMPARLAARMAIDELNATGGALIDGVSHRLILIERETANRPDAAAAAARALINLDSIDVLVGPPFSPLAIAAGAVAEASQVPLVAPMASSPQVTAERSYVMRLTFLDADQGDVLARYAFDSLGLRRTAALFDAASEYSRGVVERYGRTFTARGGRMAGVATYNGDDVGDQGMQIRRLMQEAPDAVLLPNFSVRDSSQVRLFRAAGFRGPFLGSDAWDAIALRGRQDIDGSIIVGNWDGRSDREGVRTFRDRWNRRYLGERPRATGAATYDAIRLIARAAERARVRSGMALATALRTGAPFDGAFASYRFDSSGDPIRGAMLLQMTGDSLLFRATLSPQR
jgi:branched-chain amino acid transport system substrate-binding protein